MKGHSHSTPPPLLFPTASKSKVQIINNPTDEASMSQSFDSFLLPLYPSKSTDKTQHHVLISNFIRDISVILHAVIPTYF